VAGSQVEDVEAGVIGACASLAGGAALHNKQAFGRQASLPEKLIREAGTTFDGLHCTTFIDLLSSHYRLLGRTSTTPLHDSGPAAPQEQVVFSGHRPHKAPSGRND
jgi:hypothetical protein